MAALDSDVGLWTTSAGALDAVGAVKTPWARLKGGAEGGNWRIVVRAWRGFEERRSPGSTA